MTFATAFHHAENWFFFPTTDKRYDSSDPRYSGLYGFIHEPDALPTKEHLDRWQGTIVELMDNDDPDLIWFDFGLELGHESYKQDVGRTWAGLYPDEIVSISMLGDGKDLK